ncbi:hypothetical protein fugu_012444 [Takifugu bimaculatus]|uniref:SERTA domain-containing protein n=1 Tax=Takifugu bimaculatus TaxID=433685 RepID=A0A4Z2C5E2_9TELE|nr:hypothetical protein fugu_012444 [Takifugu bimaculatus]
MEEGTLKRYMFGKGAKRKLDEDEEGLEGKTLAVPVEGGGLGLCPDGLSKVSYTLQRQTIFNISLMKLYSQRPLGEPRLERRVLINNMLRRIQDELKQEGSLRPLLFPPSPPPDDPMDEGFREAPPSFGVMTGTGQASQPSALLMPMIAPPPSPHPMVPPNCQAAQACPVRVEACPAPLDACLTPASLLEEDGGDSAFCAPSPPTPPLSPPPAQAPQLPLALLPSRAPPHASSNGFPSALSDMEVGPPTAITRTAASNCTTATTSSALTPLAQSSHLTALCSPSPTGPPRDCRSTGAKPEPAGVSLAESRCAEIRMMDALPALPPGGLIDGSSTPSSPSSSSPSGFLSDLALDDVLFADIDTSMYDFDPCTTGGAVGAAAGGGLTKLTPLVTADDLLKSLASPYSGSTPQVSASQPFKMDLTELDHIMEVLVGS